MDNDQLVCWLSAYGKAWESKDSAAFVRLFSPDVRYHWTPFDPPKQGRMVLAEAFEAAIARQDRIAFRSSVLAVNRNDGLAHWQCSFVRLGSGVPVQLDGIFLVEFNGQGECTLFREWWHSDEIRASGQAEVSLHHR